MTKHRPSPSKAGRRQQQLEKLLELMGIGGSAVDHFDRFATTQNLEEIKRHYSLQLAAGSPPARKRVKQYCAAITKVLSLSNKIGPEFFTGEIEKAGWARRNPHADEMTLHMLMEEHSDKRDNVVAVLTERRLDIDHWLKTTGDNYHKRVVTKLAVEPFVRLLIERGTISSSKPLPRSQLAQLVEALFDWLGVEQRFRLTPVAIATTSRRLANANPR
ncbi:hypothetical protein LRP30_21320 [Bradyrhizobium sp. C-145]|uniref:DUF1018 domain-containing protein n=1 Tax=Bradyrhizobium zhanjiangense TaxID=1325107 RepID=A0ABY0DB29_9BRAD|nr:MULTISPECIES: hypothetical protein [Bradyrhizobium]RXG86764.1 hypothetical protein EAS62_37050 [Bradyrhizobium zhanjiangense]UQR67631.1 hypothetical protein LRP30_21320 [Bradyrhizobium sp. C-145]